jgi:methylated-DNA-[protein]-cysteine S-methyltransferase
VVLAGNELERGGLALRLAREDRRDLRIDALDASEHAARDVVEVRVRRKRLGLGCGAGVRGGGHGAGLRDRHAQMVGMRRPAETSLARMLPGAASIDTPVGTLVVSVGTDGSVRVDWAGAREHRRATSTAHRAASRAKGLVRTGNALYTDARASTALAAAITRWIGGDADALADTPLPHGTSWQVACWRAARRIPHGQTRTYLWLAREACRELRRPASAAPALARAAGQAMRRNPAPIVVPCHRVVSASGIGGYAGSDDPRSGRVARKRWLIAIESGAA